MPDEMLSGFADEDQVEINRDVQPASSKPPVIGLIGKTELRQIQRDISETTRPRWQSGPPPKFGTKTAGKLKADQWRSCIEFDIPISLVKLWSSVDESEGIAGGDRHCKLLDSTMMLATAIR